MAIRVVRAANKTVPAEPTPDHDASADSANRPKLQAYRLKRIFLNGWNGWKTNEQFINDIGDIDEGDEYIDDWRERIAKRLDVVSQLFSELGWKDDKLGPVWFAPLPVADGPFAESAYMVAVGTDQETFVASPFELPWLVDGAIDSISSDRLGKMPSKTMN